MDRKLKRESWGQAGDTAVDSDVVLVLTRFGLRSPRQLVPIYLDYRRLKKQLKHQAGLLAASVTRAHLTAAEPGVPPPLSPMLCRRKAAVA